MILLTRRRSHRKSDSKRFYDWVERAGEDMIVAGILMRDDRCYKSSAFHCQQAIEKALKAYILLNTGDLVDGHNISWLCKKAMRLDSKFYEWLDESAVLNKCYIETRYPTDWPFDVSEEDIKVAYKMALDMFEFICRQVDEDVDDMENNGYDVSKGDYANDSVYKGNTPGQ